MALGLSLTGCGSGSGDGAGAPGAPVLDGTVSVLAASSLTEVLVPLTAAFESAYPGVHVTTTMAGSSLLAAQILEGAPADLFVAADEASLGRVAAAGLTEGPRRTIATNDLQIVVPSGNPHDIRRLEDLLGGVVLALCRSDVPCGGYADRAFVLAGLDPPRAGRVDNVKAVLARVQLGEADAGLVYRTDVLSASDVVGVDLAPAHSIRATYPASVLAEADNPEAARAFLSFLGGSQARAILGAAGFGPP